MHPPARGAQIELNRKKLQCPSRMKNRVHSLEHIYHTHERRQQQRPPRVASPSQWPLSIGLGPILVSTQAQLACHDNRRSSVLFPAPQFAFEISMSSRGFVMPVRRAKRVRVSPRLGGQACAKLAPLRAHGLLEREQNAKN